MASLIERGALDPPWPIFYRRAETSCDWVLPDIINLGRELFATFVVPKPVIKITLLPQNAVVVSVIMFPITNDTAHGFVPVEGQKGVDVIWHDHEDRDVPTLMTVVELCRLHQPLRQSRICEWLLFSRPI